jgi:predicted nucleic acid-binding Zn ribbon protein
MLALAPVTLARVAASNPVKRLPSHRRAAIRNVIAGLMREVEPTPFAAEGPCRAGVRSRLCLDGWPWGQADAAAADVVQAALSEVGAKRPTWRQGQPEFTQDGYAPLTRERCARCAKPLPEGNRKYCGPLCAKAARNDWKHRQDKEAAYAATKAYRAAWSKRQPERTCPVCGKAFQPKHKHSKICSKSCWNNALREDARLARLAGGGKVQMVCEGL